MKIKILIGMLIAAISITLIISNVSRSENTTKKIEKTFPEHIEKIADKQFSKGEDKEVDRNEWKHQPINPNISLEELAGHVNKEYGIREDILRYIEKEIPPENLIAKTAATKYAERSQFIYYKANPEEAIKAASQNSIALLCLHYSIKDNDPTLVARKIAELMRNTPERDKHMWHIDEMYFGWKITGHAPLTKNKLKEICESGNY